MAPSFYRQIYQQLHAHCHLNQLDVSDVIHNDCAYVMENLLNALRNN
jgi:hypothetical protein